MTTKIEREAQDRWIAPVVESWASMTPEEKRGIMKVKRLARNPANRSMLRRFACYPQGEPMTPARMYAFRICILRGWAH